MVVRLRLYYITMICDDLYDIYILKCVAINLHPNIKQPRCFNWLEQAGDS